MTKRKLHDIISRKTATAGFKFKWPVVGAVIIAFAGCAAQLMITDPTPQEIGAAVVAGNLANQQIAEASGLASSRLFPGVLWVVNDGGNDPLLYAVGTDGADLGAYRVEGAGNNDWEALASFKLQDTAYLLIADVGDNWQQRQSGSLYVVREPAITRTGLGNDSVAGIAWQIRFTYEDGPRDCEAVAVDAAKRRIFLLTKRSLPPVLYELPLQPADQQATIVARRLAAVPYFSSPTGMNLAPDGRSAVVLTYNHAYLFSRRQTEDWTAAFKRKPRRLRFDRLKQQEAVCFGFYGKSVYVTSEQLPAPLVRIDLEESGKKP